MGAYNSGEYRRASHEKFNAAQDAHALGHYVVSHYLCGVAVECMLRAFRWRIDPSWDSKHNLRELSKKCGVYQRLQKKDPQAFARALNEVVRRWRVSHRYSPSDRLLEDLTRLKIETGKNDRILRNNSNVMLECTQIILKECEDVY